MDWSHLAIAVVSAALGWVVRHYRTPAHHTVVDDILDKVQKEAERAKILSALNPPTPADPPKKV